MKKKFLPFILAGALTAAFAAPAAATNHTVNDCNITIPQAGGAGGLAALVAAAVQANVGVGVCNVSVELLNNSLNNLLQNADIDILNNVLNNSLNNILRNADIIDDVTVEVLNQSQIAVNVLSGPSFIINLV